ncbi:MAG TPA: NADH-quinone oxidoreductase subunit D [Candidatus Limnocylindria bacterium]|nr:NADH-quinone oxidoreductase subunit D [Candidatus Limnocylindria bacterium]
MGPQHPSTHGVLRLVLKLQGEKVIECIPVMGYLHRGLEKIFEWRTFQGGIRYADQADYVSNMLNEHCYVGAMEAIANIDVPRRAEYIRVLVDELSRCASHLVWLGTYGLDVGATTPLLYCFRDREEILDMFEELCGSRMNFNYFRPGGVLYDFPPGMLAKLERFLDRFAGHIERDYVELLETNEIFLERTIGVGTIPGDVAKAYSLTGPMLRASGVDWDLRKDRPYSIYPELKSFRSVTAVEGDAYARYKVRLGELRRSVEIVRECIANLPGGAVRARLGHVWKCPKGEAYYTVEGAKGEVGIYMISSGGSAPNPFRAKMRGPSFNNLQILPWLLRGRLVADAVAILGSIDIVLGDVDR